MRWTQTPESNRKRSVSHMGERNPMWRGDNVSYKSLHNYIRNHLSRPEFCPNCNNITPYDVANIGKYNKDLSNWRWLCRKCHMFSDGRREKLIHRMKTNHPNLGKKQSEETKSKRSKSLIGHKMSDETRKKIGDRLRGRKYKTNQLFAPR